MAKKNKYMKKIKGVYIDVYDLLFAFKTGCPAMDHAVKKCLNAGKRGYKDSIQDKEEAIKSIERSIEMEKERNDNEKIDVYEADDLIDGLGIPYHLKAMIDDHNNDVVLSVERWDIKLSDLKEIVAILERVEV